MTPQPLRGLVAALAIAFACASPARAASTPQPLHDGEVVAYDSAADALRAILGRSDPRVIGFGEYHEQEGAQTAGGVKIASSIARFTSELLPVVAEGATDLVLETWVLEGRCGKKKIDRQVAKKVEEDTKRPESTESELVALIRKAQALSVRPRVLTVSCVQYLYLSDGKGGVDYVRLLATITDLLVDQIGAALDDQRARKETSRRVLVYGGALHNDVHPRAELADFSYAKAIAKKTKGHYLEVDLYVPEWVEHDEDVTRETWWPKAERASHERPEQALVARRSKSSYVILFPRTPPARSDGGIDAGIDGGIDAGRDAGHAAALDGGAP